MAARELSGGGLYTFNRMHGLLFFFFFFYRERVLLCVCDLPSAYLFVILFVALLPVWSLQSQLLHSITLQCFFSKDSKFQPTKVNAALFLFPSFVPLTKGRGITMEQVHNCMFSQGEDETGAASAAAVWELVST